MIDNMMTSEKLPDWFVDLLILRATDGLNADQQQQFDQFVKEHSNRNQIELEAEKLELAAAAFDLGIANENSKSSQNSMPEILRQKVLDDAKRHFESEPEKEIAAATATPKTDNGLTSREALAWLAAAAAVVVLLTGWNPFALPAANVAENTPAVKAPTIEERFSEFTTGELADLVRADWTVMDDQNPDATGEVVWSDSSQSGFMVFEALKPNNPIQSQYQLWIFDTDTGQQHPVDGGVFDVTAERTIVQIDARVPVAKAVMFAITEEIPGGVVVSDRKRLPLLAKVSGL